MAVVYFTSNASTGNGSLVVAIQNASPGDVVRPDETVFERGSTIEIVLASTLTISKNLTLDGGPFRVRLNCDGLARCCSVASGVNVEITSFDFIGGGWNSQTGLDSGNANGAGISVAGDAEIVLNRCGFFGCRGTYGGALAVGTNSTAELSDCVIVGCYARGSGAGLRSQGLIKVYSSTIIGNVDAGSATTYDVTVDGSGSGTIVNSIVKKCSNKAEIGAGCVVGVAPSQIGFVASPPDDLSAETWDADAWRNWDLRLLDDASPNPSPYRDSGDVDSASTYDFQGNFRGRETNGVATCSPGAYETIQADLFWIASKFLPGAPRLTVEWVDKTATTVTVRLRWTNNLHGATSFQYQKTGANNEEWRSLETSDASAVGVSYTNQTLGATYGFRIRACIGDAYTDWTTIFFIAGERVTTEAYPAEPTFGSSYGWAASRFASASDDVAPQVGQRLFVDGDAVFVDTPAQGSSLSIGGYAVVSTGTGGTEPIVSTFGFGATFTISMPVILQRVGGFVKIIWTSGNVTINTDITMSELSIPSWASITVDGAFVSIETLRVSDSSTVVFSSVDAVLTATETATVGTATFTGTGYFATPPGTDTSSASFAETVRDCDYGANVSSFGASPKTATTALLSWVKQNLTPSVLIEETNGSVWNVVNDRVTGDSLFVDISAPKTFRLFDGEKFFTASVRPYGTAYELAEEQTIGYLKTLISTGYLN